MSVSGANTQFDKLPQFPSPSNAQNKKINKVTPATESVIMSKSPKEALMPTTQVFSSTKNPEIIKKCYMSSLSAPHTECAAVAMDMKKMYMELSLPDDYVAPTLFKGKNKKTQVTLRDMKSLNMNFIGAALFNTWLNKSKKDKDIKVYSVSIYDIKQALEEKKVTDSAFKLPVEHHHLIEVFSKKASDKLPLHWSYDHKIPLVEGAKPISSPLYGMSKGELEVMTKYIKEMLDKGFIWASSSSAASPVLFIKKPGGGLCFCVDYHQLNSITVKNKYLLPFVKETLDCICKVKIFIKINIIAAFHKLQMAQGEEWKTAFWSRYSLYEYMVMPFGLINVLSAFQHFINDTLCGYLDMFCTAYIDDILIYSNSKKEHTKHVNKVLERLKKAGLQADIDKSEFHKTEVKYLGLIIGLKGIHIDLHKIQTIVDWKTLSCI